METERTVTWKRDEGVNITVLDGDIEPVSIVDKFQNTVSKRAHEIAIQAKMGEAWQQWTWSEYMQQVKVAAKAMIKLGLQPLHGVGILGFNSPQWFFANFATIFAGGLSVGIYATNLPDICRYIADDSDADLIFVDGDKQLQKILSIWEKLPNLKAVVQWNGTPPSIPNVYSWDDFVKLSADVSDEALDERMSKLAVNKCCTLVYTSGTTGQPKGVMLSHDNIVWTALAAANHLNMKFGDERIVSFLPLSHVAAQMLDMYMVMCMGGCTIFAQPDALKGTLPQTLAYGQPTTFFAVPRVWEKFVEKLKEGRLNAGFFKGALIDWAMGVGHQGTENMANGKPVPYGWTIANRLVFQKVKTALGLQCCRGNYTGAAPVLRETVDYLMSFNISLLELYGMSECSGPATISSLEVGGFKIGSAGKDFSDYLETKIINPDKDGNGEICIRGRHVMMGYLGQEKQTQETIDADGWVHSGDTGYKDQNGFLFITGRIKELIITAGGENVAPYHIEETAKKECPWLSQAMVIGDRRKFLSLLLTVQCVVDENMQPTDELAPQALDFCKTIGSEARKVSEFIKDDVVRKEIDKSMVKVNAQAISNAQRVAKWKLLESDFSIDGGELGPTLKLKRNFVDKKYKDLIDELYK